MRFLFQMYSFMQQAEVEVGGSLVEQINEENKSNGVNDSKTAAPEQRSFDVHALFPPTKGIYLPESQRRVMTLEHDGEFKSEIIASNSSRSVILDAVTQCVPHTLYGTSTKPAQVTNIHQYTARFQYEPGAYVNATAYGTETDPGDAQVLLDTVAQMYGERFIVKSGENAGKPKLAPGPHGIIKFLNFVGDQRTTAARRNANGTTGAAPYNAPAPQQRPRTAVSANMSMRIRQMEVVYADGFVEQRIKMAHQGGSTATNASQQEVEFNVGF